MAQDVPDVHRGKPGNLSGNARFRAAFARPTNYELASGGVREAAGVMPDRRMMARAYHQYSWIPPSKLTGSFHEPIRILIDPLHGTDGDDLHNSLIQ